MYIGYYGKPAGLGIMVQSAYCVLFLCGML